MSNQEYLEPEDEEPCERPALDECTTVNDVAPINIAPVCPHPDTIYVVDVTDMSEFALNLVEIEDREVNPVKPVFKTEVYCKMTNCSHPFAYL